MKRLAIALLLLVAGAAAAELHVGMQTYTPVIRIATPEGLVYTTQLEARPDHGGCVAASRLFLAALEPRCAECEVLFARCERDVEAGDQPDARYIVSVPGLRIDIAGPGGSTKRSCEQIARDFVRRGMPSASCALPKDGTVL